MYTHITDPPEPPLNLTMTVADYYDSGFTMAISWIGTEHNEAQLVHYVCHVTSEASNEQTFNTTNNSTVIYNLPYNKNITVYVSGHNCIGGSPQVNATFTGKKVVSFPDPTPRRQWTLIEGWGLGKRLVRKLHANMYMYACRT